MLLRVRASIGAQLPDNAGATWNALRESVPAREKKAHLAEVQSTATELWHATTRNVHLASTTSPVKVALPPLIVILDAPTVNVMQILLGQRTVSMMQSAQRASGATLTETAVREPQLQMMPARSSIVVLDLYMVNDSLIDCQL